MWIKIVTFAQEFFFYLFIYSIILAYKYPWKNSIVPETFEIKIIQVNAPQSWTISTILSYSQHTKAYSGFFTANELEIIIQGVANSVGGNILDFDRGVSGVPLTSFRRDQIFGSVASNALKVFYWQKSIRMSFDHVRVTKMW